MENEKLPARKTNNRNRNTFYELNQQMGKLPPQATDVEEAVLGALMLEKDSLNIVLEILKPESFYKEAHQLIFKAIVDLFDRSEPVDIITVSQELRSMGVLEKAGGPYYVTELTNRVNSAANIEFHSRIIAQQSIKRDLINIATEIHREAYEETSDVFDLLNKTEQSIYKVSEANIRKNYADMRSIMHQALKELQDKKDTDGMLTGVPSGFTNLDRVTSGWQKSDLVILAARPGMGKTAFVVSAMRNAAVNFNVPVAIFSLEMSSVQLATRLISAEAELESEKLRKGNLEEYEWQQLHHRIPKLTDAPIYIDDTAALSIRELRTKCRRLKAKHDIQMIIIDYLQLMSGDGGGKGGNREQEIAGISRALKNLAKELEVPVIALSQLSRAVESRPDKRPQLSDLRESGAIEQDADMVVFLYRPDYYGIEEDEMGNSLKGVGEVIIAKHRNGSLEDVRLRFVGKYTKFTDLDDPEYSGGSNFSFDSGMSSFSAEIPSGGAQTFSSRINDLGKPGGGGLGGDEDLDPPF